MHGETEGCQTAHKDLFERDGEKQHRNHIPYAMRLIQHTYTCYTQNNFRLQLGNDTKEQVVQFFSDSHVHLDPDGLMSSGPTLNSFSITELIRPGKEK